MIQTVISLLVAIILTCSSTGASCPPDLKNRVVYRGDKETLIELPEDPNVVLWDIYATSDKNVHHITNYGGYRNPELEGLFYPNQSGLVVLDATTTESAGGPISTSGFYEASCIDDGSYVTAKFVVVIRPPECSSDDSSPDSVQLSCAISYADINENPISANMIWKVGGVFYKTETPDRTESNGEDGNSVWVSTSTITVDNNAAANYECTVTFNAPVVDVPDFAMSMNAPEFSASCSVSVVVLDVTTRQVEATTTTLEPSTTTTTLEPSTTTTTLEPSTTTTTLQPSTTTTTLQPSTTTTTLQPSTTTTTLKPSTTTTTLQPSTNTTTTIPAGSGSKCSCIRILPLLVFKLNCSLNFTSALPNTAKVTWIVNGGYYTTDSSPKIQTKQSVSTATSSITLVGISIPGFSFRCSLRFGEPINTPDSSQSCSGSCPFL